MGLQLSIKLKKQIRAGLVGAGNMGREWAKALAAHPDFHFSGVFSRSTTPTRKISGDFDVVVAESLEDLNKLAPEVVIIAVPELALPSVFGDCSEFEWTILVEKPAGTDLEVARHLQQVAGRRRGSSFVALNRRFYSSTQELLARLDSGRSSAELLMADQHDPIAAKRSGQPDEVVEKWHYVNAIHTLDLVRFIGRGEPEVIAATRETIGPRSFVVKADLRFTSSDRATYISVWNAPGPWMLQCFTENQMLELRPFEQLWQTVHGSRQSQRIPQHEVDVLFKPGLWRMLDELSLFSQSGSCELPSFGDSLKSMSLVNDVFVQGGVH